MLLVTILTLLAPAVADVLPQGTQLTYRGRFVAEKGEADTPEKQFEVKYVVHRPQAEGATLYWLTEERGRGSWPWLDRFGKWELNAELRPAAGTGPALSDERAEGTHVIPLLPPLLTYAEPFAAGLSWFEGNLEFHVASAEMKQGHETWRVEVRSPVGRRRTLWIDQTSPVIVAATEVVFIGQGEQHELRWELTDRQVMEPAAWDTAQAAWEEFLRLRSRLGVEPRTRDLRWTTERLALLRADLPAIAEKARSTPLAKLAQAAEQDAKNQKERASALGALEGKRLGREAPQPAMETLQGQPFAWDDVKGKVTILHFWEYRDTPLEEPYGQVAYLDFLARQFAKQDVKVFGVVSDERVTQPDTKRAGVQSAKKLHAFMNLSYPLLVDSGAAIKEFGDPRATGAKLPLFVVIDREGKVVHYHPGFYEVNRDRGLEELSTLIKKNLP